MTASLIPVVNRSIHAYSLLKEPHTLFYVLFAQRSCLVSTSHSFLPILQLSHLTT